MSTQAGPGNDIVWAPVGLTILGGGYSSDIMNGGSGNDVLYPRNDPAGGPRPDLVQRRDVVYPDTADIVVGCESQVYSYIPAAQWNKYLAEQGLQGRV